MPIEHYVILRQMSKNFYKNELFHTFYNTFFCRFKLAINDCTSSIKLDNTYVKTYQRRSAAYMALGMYNEAKKDINEVIKLEPNNKQAKHDIEVINNKIKQVGRYWKIIS